METWGCFRYHGSLRRVSLRSQLTHSEAKAERSPVELWPKRVPPLDGSADRANKLLSSIKGREVQLATCYIQESDRLAQK